MALGRLKGGLVALLLLMLGACAAPQTAALTRDPGALPTRAEVPEVPFYPQEDYYCGPAALAGVLGWSGAAVTPEALAAQVYTPERRGTLRSDILAAARRHGRLAVPVASLDGLLSEIAAGHPVLVFQNLAFDWYPQWHYAVAVGYDLEREDIVLHSGRQARRHTPLDTFERTWRRGDHWALVVLAPGRLPASAGHDETVQAAAGLERAGQREAAAAAYRAVLARWPESYVARLGLGNTQYAVGDLAAAERAFRAAIAAEPQRAEAWNNLAYVLAARGDAQAAGEAARQALRRSPGNRQPYLHTLLEVSGL